MHVKHGPKHAPRKPVTGLTTWIEVWNRFMGVRIATKPLELNKYQTLITTAFQDYPPEACIQYDCRLRQLAAKNKELAWDKYKEASMSGAFHPNRPVQAPFVPTNRLSSPASGHPQALPLTQLQRPKSASGITTPVAAQWMGVDTSTCAPM